MSLNVWSEAYNPMIRLKDNLDVPASDILYKIIIKER